MRLTPCGQRVSHTPYRQEQWRGKPRKSRRVGGQPPLRVPTLTTMAPKKTKAGCDRRSSPYISKYDRTNIRKKIDSATMQRFAVNWLQNTSGQKNARLLWWMLFGWLRYVQRLLLFWVTGSLVPTPHPRRRLARAGQQAKLKRPVSSTQLPRHRCFVRAAQPCWPLRRIQ